MSFCVLVITHNFKSIYFGFHKERREARKAAITRLCAVCSGVGLGIIGAYVAPKEPLWFWVVSGILSSGGSIALVDIYKKWFKK